MESPVRICLGAALVVHLLLLSSATVEVNALPEATATTLKNERLPRFSKVNGTSSVARNRSKTPDVALNELNPKDTTSEEHSEKNAKYKDRGRFRFGSRSSTESPRRRVTQPPSTEASKIMIVTPTPPQKNLSQIIDSMREFKKTKIPAKAISTTPISLNDLSSSNPGTSKATITESPKQSLTVSVKSSITVAPSSSTPLNIVKKDVSAQLEEYEDEDEEEEKEAFEKFTSSKFHDDFFTIPSFGDDDDFTQDSTKDATNNKVHSFFSTPSFPKYSTYFPEKISHSSKEDEEDEDVPFKASSFFRGFESDLTTPKNDFFDKKFQEISSSIIKNLASVKVKTPAPNTTNLQKIVKENVGLKKVTDGTPTNKSSVFIKNTKEIRLLDNEGAGTANKELSDVHGTSIYYEMSVLSTETYAIDHSDGDCENDTSPFETVPTPSTTNDEELAPLKSTAPTLFTIPTKTDLLEPKSTVVSTFTPILSSISSVKSSSQNSILSTEKTSTRIYTSSYSSRNRGYKRLNFTGTRDPNSVTVRPDQVTANQFNRPVTRFHYTTPKAKPIWMSPRRNGTARPYQRSTVPTTIYSEHFSIKEKSSTTPRPNRQPNRPSILTTVSSDIDPVLQSDVGGIKKIVHSQSISDNSIPTLWKRGSTKFGASTVAPQEQISEMEIPPTLTAWALASLRIPPSMASPAVANGTSTTKSDDENELQKVGELTDKKESMIASSTTSTTTGNINDFTSKIISEIDQNKLPWRPVYTATSLTPDVLTETTTSEAKSAETQPAESNISAQSSVEQIISTPTKTSESNVTVSDSSISNDESSQSPSWVPVTTSKVETTSTEEMKNASPTETITPTKSTRFESITKLPAGVTTPQGDEIISKFSEKPEIITEIRTEIGTQSTPTTTDYEITTITFPDKLTQATEDSTEAEVEQVTTPVWHPVVPTRTRITTLKDIPVTTYRPHYITTTDESEETTTDLPETTSMKFEVSSSVERATRPPKKSQPIYTTTEEVSTTSTEQETSTTVEIITEINTQRGTSRNQYTTKSMPDTTIHVITTTDKPTDTSPSNLRDVHNSSEENSGSNEVVTQETKATSTTTPTSLPTQTPTKAKMPTEEQNEILELSTAMPPEIIKESTTVTQNGKYDTTMGKDEPPTETTTDFMTTKSVNELEDLTSYAGEVTTESSSRVLTTEEAGSGAAVAIAVSTIGVIALILLVGLLLVVRRRGRRGVYAQRCTPLSLDAYSLDSVSVGQRKGNQRLRASKRSYGNPAFDDEVTSHPMQFAALASFALDVESMSAEFGEIPAAAARPDAVPAGCEDKNRYSNVLPLPETRVPLQQLANDPASTYIHANYVTGPGNIKNYYIACQAPLPNTVVDVWRMVWEQNSRLIVMLTEYMENGVEKCFEYLPPSEISDNKRTFGDFQIILKKREAREKYAVSTVQLINLRTRTWREITHLWYFWPAKGVPEDFDSIIDFLSEMRGSMKIAQTAKEYDEEGVEVIYGDQSRASFGNMARLRDEAGSNGHGLNVYSPQRAEEAMRRGNNGTLGRMKTASEIEGVRPCVVMCASGAGRAAAMIALDICARALAAGAVDVPRVVRELRAQRPHALANKHHYIFLYRVLSEYGNKLMGGGVDTI